MQRVHFIAIGEDLMLDLAITLRLNKRYNVSGSDINLSEESYDILKNHGVDCDKNGWFPQSIQKGISAIVVGKNVLSENPELTKAKELGLKIYTLPEYIFQQTRSRTRIVVSGSHGTSTISAMILFVLKQSKVDADYFVENRMTGIENKIRLTFDARIAVLEVSESIFSKHKQISNFQHFKPHIAVLSRENTLDKSQVSITSDTNDLKKIIDTVEVQGRLIYHDKDENINQFVAKLRRDIVTFSYKSADHAIINNITCLLTKKGSIPLEISGKSNMEYLIAARLVCKQIGVNEDQFNNAISLFRI